MQANYGAYPISAGAGLTDRAAQIAAIQNERDYQKQLLDEERARQGQLNVPAGILGLLTGAFSSGKLSPSADAMGKGQKVDLAGLLSPEALYGAATGATQPVANSGKDYLTGVLSGLQGTQTVNAANLNQEKEALNLLSNFDKATPNETGAINLHEIAPKTYPTDTWVKRKPMAPSFWSEMAAITGKGGITPTSVPAGTTAQDSTTGKTVTYDGSKWLFEDGTEYKGD